MDNNFEKPKNPHLFWKGLVYVTIAVLVGGWLLYTPSGVMGKADAIGYAVCHQIDVRSFHIGSRPLPLCARCSGMFLGALVGLMAQFVLSKRRGGLPSIPVSVGLGVLFLGFAFDGVNSFFQLTPLDLSAYEPQNWLRLLTGTGMGLVIAAAIFPTFNQTVWLDYPTERALPGLKHFGILLIAGLGMVGLVLTENPLILYPLALMSAATVVLLLTLIYTIVWLTLLNLENRFTKFSQLGFYLALGFMTGMTQIILFNAARYWLTGTWDGFQLG
jgi:uncharacterized membrane protein